MKSPGDSPADIYPYKDRNGNRVLTDTPPDNTENMERIRDREGRSSRISGFRDIERDLTAKYRPQGGIETASLSAVTIKTSMGLGSGFFINGNGYILTNRHVVRGDDAQIRKTEEYIALHSFRRTEPVRSGHEGLCDRQPPRGRAFARPLSRCRRSAESENRIMRGKAGRI